MARKSHIAQLSKLSRPRLYDALPRERLFRLLDKASEHSAAWSVAPPGAGKSTLVAGWLESRGISDIWCQVDEGDADLASFFYYLGMAERARSSRLRNLCPLPLLTPEHLVDVKGFARRFFRDLFGRLGAPSVLVLDNFQEAGSSAAFHDIVRIAIENAPPGMLIVIVSRDVPNEQFAQLRANQMLVLIEWESLKLTSLESRKIAQLYGQEDVNVLDELYLRSGGWAAGLILLAERLRRGACIEDLTTPESLEEVFAYFAGQLFDRSDVDNRRMLIQLSYLPSIPESIAESLTGNASSLTLLEHLYRRHLFTDRRHGKEPVYQFHGLFRSFLQHRAQTDLDAEQQRSIAKRAAQLLDAAGEVEDVMALHVAAQDWVAAQNLILAQAPTLIVQGRWRIVVNWIEALPENLVAENCWLLYWLGTAWTPVDPVPARSALDRCYRRSIEEKNRVCEVQVAARFVENSLHEYGDFVSLDRWIRVLEQIAEPDFEFPTPDMELRAVSAIVISLAIRRAGHPELPRFVSRCYDLLQTGVDVNLRLLSGAFLMLYGNMCGRLDLAQRSYLVVRPLHNHPDVTSLAKCMSLAIGAETCVHTENFEEGSRIIERLELIAREENLRLSARSAYILGCYLDFRRGDLRSARERIRLFEQILNPSVPYEAASLVGMKCYMGLFSGHPEQTIALASELIRLFDLTGSLWLRLFMYAVVIWANAALNRFEEAERVIREYRKIEPDQHMEWISWGPLVTEAWIALQRNEAFQFKALLRKMFCETRPRDLGYGYATIWSKAWMPVLCERALESEIEVENVRDYIREYKVEAPELCLEGWPWQIRIRCLGPFEILIEGSQPEHRTRTPRKLLALLKAIIALGSRDVLEQKLTDALWPDQDGDAAHQSFTTTLHRLRKLLGDKSLIQHRDGRISLDTARIWVDGLTFEALCTRKAEPDHVITMQAMELYRGDFLVHDDAPWVVSTREKLRVLYLGLVTSAARLFEQEGRHEEALDLYRRGIKADGLAEIFHQGLMRCYHQVGRIPEALDAYLRMRELLARAHGVQPSPATEELYRKLSRR